MPISTDYDFTDCKYNPRKMSFVDDIKAGIPAFKQYDGDHADKVFSYIVALYDKHSPMREKVPEYFERKVRCAEVVHMPRTPGGGFTEFTREVLEGRNDEVNELGIAYLADLGDMDYMMFISEMTMFHNLNREILSGTTDDKAYKTLQSLSTNMQARMRKIFNSGERDELTRIRILLYESAERDRRKMNPEAIIAMLNKEGDFPGDWSRYGSKYKPEPLRFIGHELEQG
jgi:hypothetical protein